MDKVLGKNKYYSSRKLNPTDKSLAFDRDFRITHYAGDVTYNVCGFIDKNRDTLYQDLKRLLYNRWNTFSWGADRRESRTLLWGAYSQFVGAIFGSEFWPIIEQTVDIWLKKPYIFFVVNESASDHPECSDLFVWVVSFSVSWAIQLKSETQLSHPLKDGFIFLHILAKIHFYARYFRMEPDQ